MFVTDTHKKNKKNTEGQKRSSYSDGVSLFRQIELVCRSDAKVNVIELLMEMCECEVHALPRLITGK